VKRRALQVTDEQFGFQILMGIEHHTEKFLLRGEARYISAQVEIEDFESLEWIPELDVYVRGTTIDLDGLFLNIGATIKF